MDTDIREKYNRRLSKKLEDCVTLGYEEYCKYIVEAAKETIRENKEEDMGWFKYSEQTLLLLIRRRNQLLSKAREEPGENKALKQQCQDAKSDVKNAVAMAKGNWVKHMVSKIGDFTLNPKEV